MKSLVLILPFVLASQRVCGATVPVKEEGYGSADDIGALNAVELELKNDDESSNGVPALVNSSIGSENPAEPRPTPPEDPNQMLPCASIIDSVVAENLIMLNWIYGIAPKKIQDCKDELHKVNEAVCENGKIGGLEWLHNIQLAAPFKTSHLSTATEKGHLNVLILARKIDSNSLPTVKDLNVAAGKGWTKILVWAHSQNDKLIPDTTGANKAAKKGHIAALEWLDSKGVHPDQSGLNKCVKHNSLEFIQWLVQNYPDLNKVALAINHSINNNRSGDSEHICKTSPRSSIDENHSSEMETKGSTANPLIKNAPPRTTIRRALAWSFTILPLTHIGCLILEILTRTVLGLEIFTTPDWMPFIMFWVILFSWPYVLTRPFVQELEF